MPMFVVTNSTYVTLEDNKTEGHEFAQIDNVRGLKASLNEAGSKYKSFKREDLIDFRPNIFGIGLNGNELARRVRQFIKKQD